MDPLIRKSEVKDFKICSKNNLFLHSIVFTVIITLFYLQFRQFLMSMIH